MSKRAGDVIILLSVYKEALSKPHLSTPRILGKPFTVLNGSMEILDTILRIDHLPAYQIGHPSLRLSLSRYQRLGPALYIVKSRRQAIGVSHTR